MESEAAGGLRGLFARSRGLIFPVLIVTSVLVIVAPLPPLLMDLLLAQWLDLWLDQRLRQTLDRRLCPILDNFEGSVVG